MITIERELHFGNQHSRKELRQGDALPEASRYRVYGFRASWLWQFNWTC